MKLDDLELLVYDCEVFAHDWLVVMKDQSGNYMSFWNDPANLCGYMDIHDDAVYVGFNSKHYDQYIVKTIAAGCTPEEVKEVNDFIIGGGTPWEHPYLCQQNFKFWFNNCDLMDDTQKGTSLKSIEGHLGMSIEESSVDFNYEKKLTKAQREEVERYCRHDVDATEKLLEIRRDYLETKMHLAGIGKLDQIRALGMTEPKLAAAFMGAKAIEHDDERDYVFPDRLDYDYIPNEVIEFFERIWDNNIPDAELFKTKLNFDISDCPTVFGFGGVHGALPKYRQKATKDRLILNYDVSGMYPSLMIEYGYVSRAVPSPEVFANVRAERSEAKRRVDKRTSDALKSPLNKSYGAMLNPYNAMYDPKMARSVCISGQLSLTELAIAYSRVDGLKIIQLNTDGIMISIPKSEYDTVLSINDWWQDQTSLELEEDRIDFIWQKDVNNYVCRMLDGKEKVKGGYLVRGIAPIGAWSINNNATIVAEALKRYLLDGIPIADTINACDDPSKFQLIAKASGKYERVYQEVFPEPVGKAGVETVERQRCNRVFATTDARYGRLYKVKAADGSVAKIESLPEHCLIWNEEIDTAKVLPKIDKSFYIALAEKRASDFKEGKLPTATKAATKSAATKSTATKAAPKTESVEAKIDYSKMNIYQKLAIARLKFLESGVEKTGKNRHLQYKYFTLDDIVPAQTKIFAEVGLLEVFTYKPGESQVFTPKTLDAEFGDDSEVVIARDDDLGFSVLFNTDNQDEHIVFRFPWADMPSQTNKEGVLISNPLQDSGKVQTYLRRYLKMQILDIAEYDETDGGEPEKEKAPSASSTKAKATSKTGSRKPATPKERKAAATKVAAADEQASEFQVKQLKKQMTALKKNYGENHPEVGAFIASLGAETDNLKSITKTRCESAIRELGEMKEKFDTSEGEDA